MSSAVSRPRSLGPIEAPGRASVPAIFPGEERAPCRPRFRHSEHCPPEKEPRPALPPSSASCAPLPAEERARLPFQEDVGMNLSHHAPERAPSSPEARGGAKGKRLLGAGTRDSRCQGLGGGFEGTRSSLRGEICHVSSDTGAKISPRSGASFHRPHKARRGGSVWVLGGFRDRCWTVAEMRHDTCMEKRVCYRDTDGSGANLGGIAKGEESGREGRGQPLGTHRFSRFLEGKAFVLSSRAKLDGNGKLPGVSVPRARLPLPPAPGGRLAPETLWGDALARPRALGPRATLPPDRKGVSVEGTGRALGYLPIARSLEQRPCRCTW